MRRMSKFLYMIVVPIVLYGPVTSAIDLHSHQDLQHHQRHTSDDCKTPLFDNLGSLEFLVSTASTLAQAYVNQGMILTFGFNHAEAVRAFKMAQEIDPSCAMCYYGEALALGPNINKPMTEEDGVLAVEAINKAQALKASASEKERDLIEALAVRYKIAGDQVNRATLDAHYAAAMKNLQKKYPDDVHIGALYAESLMDLSPWNYWKPDGSYGPHTEEMLSVLKRVLAAMPEHPGANHYLIHVVESVRPTEGIEAADRLRDLVPGAGHLQHMPAHIYIRVGRYLDAVTANIKGIAADKGYLAGCHSPGFYPMMYVPHNYDFLIAAATLAGKSELALQTATGLREYILPFLQHHPQMYDNQAMHASLLLTRVRFAKWDQILAEPKPDASLLMSLALWHYARSIALMNTDQLKESAEELVKLKELAARPELETALLMGVNTVTKVLAIAVYEAEGLLAAKEGQLDKAEKLLRLGVGEQDSLTYMEPPPWYRSVRIVLGEVLLQAGKYMEAEQVFLSDMKKFPENGYALYGLYKSLIGQERDKEAWEAYGRYQRSFLEADIALMPR